MFKKHFNCALWLGILNLPLACFFGLSYIPQGETPWFVLCTFFFALIGQLFVYFAISSVVFILPVFNWRKNLSWPALIYATLILSICHLLLNIDAYLFDSYDQHLLAFLEQINRQGVVWDNINWIHWGMQVVIIVGYSSIILSLSLFLAMHRTMFWPFALLVIFMYLLSSGIFMFAHSRNIQPLEELEEVNLPKFINIGQIVSNFSSQQADDAGIDDTSDVDSSTDEEAAAASAVDADQDVVVVPSETAPNDAADQDSAANSDLQSEGTDAATGNLSITEEATSDQSSTQNAEQDANADQNTILSPATQDSLAPSGAEADAAGAAANAATGAAGAATSSQPVNSVSTVEPAHNPHDFNPFASQENN